MKEYKRLTEKVKLITREISVLNCNVCPKKGTCKNEVNYRDTCLRTAIDKLAELEDKIENKTLVEFKFSIPERVYFIDYTYSRYSCPNCGETRYEKHLNGIKSGFITGRTFNEYRGEISIGYSIQTAEGDAYKNEEKLFKTETEAEEKLKELKG